MKKIILMMIAMVVVLTGCANSTDPSDAYKDETPTQIYARGKALLLDKSYNEATKRFEALDVQYPFDKETEKAQLYLIYTYYMKEEYSLSVSAADRYIRIHPTSPDVDYAYYMRGISDYYQDMGILERIFAIDLAKRDLTQIQKSYTDFAELTTRFPDSRYAASAHQYQIFLRNVLADHELHIAQYYYDRKAYVASANRAADIVAHYQGAPQVMPALDLLAKSYQQLGMRKMAQDTRAVLQYNAGSNSAYMPD